MSETKIDDSQINALLQKAEQVMHSAYSPYSTIRIGAAALTAQGNIYCGCNVENSSYGLTVCAERAAAFAAVSGGSREIIAIAIMSESERVNSVCGACRQVLSEFILPGSDMIIIFRNPVGTRCYLLSELLPEGFKL